MQKFKGKRSILFDSPPCERRSFRNSLTKGAVAEQAEIFTHAMWHTTQIYRLRLAITSYRLSVFRWSDEILRQLPTNKARTKKPTNKSCTQHRSNTQGREDQKASFEQTVSRHTSVFLFSAFCVGLRETAENWKE
jgi:hypothetical protein